MKKTSSRFGRHITDYIAYRIASGFAEVSYDRLYDFDRFLSTNNYDSDGLTKEVIDLWDARRENESRTSQGKRISVVRGFCQYLNALGIKSFVSANHVKAEKKVPFVFSKKEIIKLFPLIDDYCSSKEKHYKYMLPVIYRLLYVTGMRVGEAINLEYHHLDLKNGVITVIESKNAVSRLVYISDDVCRMMEVYLDKIRAECLSEKWIFPGSRIGNHICRSTVSSNFKRIVESSGYTNSDYHPVLHSLRHSYVVHVIDGWVNSGENLNEMIPYLQKQLGHQKIESTMYYYHLVYDSFETIVKKTRDVYPEVIRDGKTSL